MHACLSSRLFSLLLAFLLVAPLLAQAPADGAARLRTLFFQRNYEAALLEAPPLLAAAPADQQLKAWHVLNMVRGGREDEAVAAAKAMTAGKPEDGWSWIAQAGALHWKTGQAADAIAAAEKALQLMPDHADAIWLRAQTLAGDSKRRAEAIAFVDANRSRVKNPAELLAVKAYAMYVMASDGGSRDEVKTKAAFEAFDEAHRADPANVNALYLPATYLDSLRRSDDALALVKKALAVAPNSTPVRQAYWNAIKGSQKLTATEKNDQLAADLNAFVATNGNRPGALRAAAFLARDLKLPDRQRDLEDRLLAQFNDSVDAEWVLTYRLREFRTPESLKKSEYRQLLREYVARPKHYHIGLLGEQYRQLFFNLIEDESPNAEELLRVADGMLKYETTNIHLTHVASAIALANKKIHLDKAEQIARGSMVALIKRLEENRSFYKDDKEYQDRLKTAPAIGHDALGWVLFAKGQVAEAEKELLKAHELSPANRDNLYHLGRFYEAKNDLAKAEEYYVKGLSIQSTGVNPSQAALKTLFEKREGKAEGFDKYLENLRAGDRTRRMEKVLAARIPAPAAVTSFNLKNLEGQSVSLESLKGKIVVINFWGIWCGWCVLEMPDLQKLHEKYKADPDVAILTIDNDRNPSDVPPWMKQKGYTFPVLIDSGYVDKVNVHAFPTTWFLDREGRKVFEKVGWSEKLLEEFSWRIEAIRGTTTAAGR